MRHCEACSSAIPSKGISAKQYSARRFCSRACEAKSRERRTPEQSKPCEQCGKRFTNFERDLCGVRFERLRFCGNACAMKWRVKEGLTGQPIHGMARTSEYRIWTGMKQRCENEKQTGFKDYGGRGIRVCEEWSGEGGFELFFAHIGRRPTTRHTVDRIDNSRGYEPGNVRWATRKEQLRNTRRNVFITLDGETLTAAEWIERKGLRRDVVYSRLKKGWDPTEAITRPVGKRGANVEHAWARPEEKKRATRSNKAKVAA